MFNGFKLATKEEADTIIDEIDAITASRRNEAS